MNPGLEPQLTMHLARADTEVPFGGLEVPDLAIRVAVAGQRSQARVLSRRATRAAVVIAAAGLIMLVAFLAFLAGEHQQRPFTVLKGIAHVGDHMATITAAGTAYGMDGDVPWVDQQGTTHSGDWPACLGGLGRNVPVTFGGVLLTAPTGQSWYQVVWVDCRS